MPAAGYAWADIGECLLEHGEIAQAVHLFERGLTENSSDGQLNRPRFCLGRAAAYLVQGEIERALSLVDEARQYSQERGLQNYYAAIDLLDARLSTERGDQKKALQLAAQAEEQARRLGQRPLALQACRIQAELLDAHGDVAAAQAKQQQVEQLVGEMAALFTDPNLAELYQAGQK
jgi:ATP/maltotriose-dependent transcriptional regulator MalT